MPLPGGAGSAGRRAGVVGRPGPCPAPSRPPGTPKPTCILGAQQVSWPSPCRPHGNPAARTGRLGEFNLVPFLREPGCPWRPAPSWGSESLPVAKEEAAPLARCQAPILIKSIFSPGGRLPGALDIRPPQCPQERRTCPALGRGPPPPRLHGLPSTGGCGVPSAPAAGRHRVRAGAQR